MKDAGAQSSGDLSIRLDPWAMLGLRKHHEHEHTHYLLYNLLRPSGGPVHNVFFPRFLCHARAILA